MVYYTGMIKKLGSLFSSTIRGISHRISWNVETLGYVLLLATFTLLPVLFIPIFGVTISAGKSLLVTILIGIVLLLYTFSVLMRGEISIPKNYFFIGLFSVVITTILASFFSGFIQHSLFGYAGEITTSFFIILFAVTVFLSSRFINSFERVSGVYFGFIITSIIFALYHILRFIFGPQLLSFGVNSFPTATLIGSWTDLAIFFGGAILLIVSALEFISLRKKIKISLGVLGIILAIILVAMNVKIVWIILAMLSFVLSLYIFIFAYWDPASKTYKKDTRFPGFTLALFIISICAIMFSGFTNNIISKHQNLNYFEVRPSLITNIQVTGSSLVHNFATGTGSNSFNNMWELVKPQNISGTEYGSANFQLGYSTFFTYIALGGILGILAWLLFFGGLFTSVAKTVSRQFDHPMSRFFITSLTLLIIYLSILGCVYTIGASLLIMLAIIIGSFFGILYTYEYGQEIKISFLKDPRASFFGIISIVIIVLVSIFGMYTMVRKFTSLARYQKGVIEISRGNNEQGISKLNQALILSNNDIYNRKLSMVAIGNMETFLSSNDTQKLSKEDLSTSAQRLASIAISYADTALKYNNKDADNWTNQGDIFRFMTRLGIAGAYDKAVASYTEAQKRNPKDTTMDLYFAQLEIAKNNNDKALEMINASIEKQPTRDAYIIKYQMNIAAKNIDGAFSALRQALSLDQNNAALYYEYGLLSFSQKKYLDSVLALNQTLVLNPSYVQAYFYLAIALEKSGQTEQANQVIDFLRKNNENTDKVLNQIRGTVIPSDTAATETPVAKTTKK